MIRNSPATTGRFTMADLADAAVEILGDPWHAEPSPWWVRADIKDAEGHALTVGVDDEDLLYVAPEGDNYDPSRVFLPDVRGTDGIAAAAEAVADAVLRIRPLL